MRLALWALPLYKLSSGLALRHVHFSTLNLCVYIRYERDTRLENENGFRFHEDFHFEHFLYTMWNRNDIIHANSHFYCKALVEVLYVYCSGRVYNVKIECFQFVNNLSSTLIHEEED